VSITGEPLQSGTAVGTDLLRWDHVGLNVADLDAASAWYGQVLGLRTEREFAVPGTGLRGCMLMHSSGYRLELIERSGSVPGIQAAGPGEAALTRGFGHMAFQVADLDAVYDAMLAAGASARVPPTDAPRPGARMAWVADPEGNLVELITQR
jgi:catechol 2,3-dioxygenase-like lactoylglutathione lyase family enzyme